MRPPEYPKPTEAVAVRCSVTCQTSVTSCGFFGIGSGLDVGLDLREKVERVEALVVALDRVGVEHHARTLAQLAADHLVLGARVAGDLDDRDARDVDVVFDVGGAGLEIDRRRDDAALEVADLEMEVVFVDLLQRLVVGVANGVGVDAAGLERQHREDDRPAAAADRRR